MDAVIGEHAGVRAKFVQEFGDKLSEFGLVMASAFIEWQTLDKNPTHDEKHANLSSFVYMAINYHVQAHRLLFAGMPIPSGHMERQVIESISMAFISSDRKLPYLSDYMADRFSTNKAVPAVLKHRRRLGLNDKALQVLEGAHRFYAQHSHPTLLSLAHSINFNNGIPSIAFGPTYDEGKRHLFYAQEVERQTTLAITFPNFVHTVKTRWENT